MDFRIFLVGIAMGIVLSGGTAVFAQSNSTENNTDIDTAEELEQLTGNNSLMDLGDMPIFNGTNTNQTGDQASDQTSNMSG